MTATTSSAFDKTTEATEVAATFAESIKGRTILVTGINKRGIGFAIVQAFASQAPRCLILAGRSQHKLDECVETLRTHKPDSIDIRPLLVDLSSQQSIKNAAAEVLGWRDVPVIDLVINNAGLMRHGDSFDGPIPRSQDGIEEMFAINHLGHFLLTSLIMPKMVAAAKVATIPGSVRIINLSSSAAFISPLRASDLDWQKPSSQLPEAEKPKFAIMKMAGMSIDEDLAYIPTAAYCHSKTCNILFSVGLNDRLYAKYSILSLSLNPGDVKTELARHTDPDWLAKAVGKRESAGLMHWKTQGQGASTSIVAACDPKLTLPNVDGRGYYLHDCQIAQAPAWGVNKDDAEKLWQLSEELVGQEFSF